MACLGEMNLGTLDKRTIIFVLFEQSRIRGTFDRVFWRWVLMQGFRDNATMKTFTKTSTTCFVCSARCVLNALYAGRSFGLAFVALVATTVANAQVASGPVEAWGNNGQGQTNIPEDLGPCTQIAAGLGHIVAIKGSCPADIIRDGVVDGIDLGAILSAWGTSGGTIDTDINNDGVVNGLDLSYILGGWGPCP